MSALDQVQAPAETPPWLTALEAFCTEPSKVPGWTIEEVRQGIASLTAGEFLPLVPRMERVSWALRKIIPRVLKIEPMKAHFLLGSIPMRCHRDAAHYQAGIVPQEFPLTCPPKLCTRNCAGCPGCSSQ